MPQRHLVWPGFGLLAVLFYALPLFSPQVSIHWDLADVSYPVQKYFSEAVRAGHLPHWTPYLFSGMPLLSDPAVGAWYPLHWPFFAIGIAPRSLVWELVLHAFLALGGAYLLALRWVDDVIPAAVAAVLYAFNGFFAAHATELGLFEAAALAPWLLWAAAERSYVLVAFVAGLIVLTGHFGAAAFCGLALVAFVAATAPRSTPAVLGAAAVGGFVLGAVVLLPWFEINHYTTRFLTDPQGAASASVAPRALGTLMSADYFGLISGSYKGPASIRLSYFYGGLVAVPLMIAGLARRKMLWAVAALIVPALWYAFGPAAGLARVLAVIPAFRDAGPAASIWFVVALGVAMAAGSGVAWIDEKLGRKRLPYVLLVLTIADLWFWNEYRNPLTFAHASFADLYGKREASFEGHLKEVKQGTIPGSGHNGLTPVPFYRIWAPEPIAGFGPLDGALIDHIESTWGAGLLEMNRHAEYMRAIPSNISLVNGLSITDLIDVGRGALAGNPAALPRVTSPGNVMFVSSAAEARAALLKLNQDDAAVVEGAARALDSGAAEVRITGYEGDVYRVHYKASLTAGGGDRLLRVAVPYAPGWRAEVDGRTVQVVAVDYALSGAFVPAGEHDVVFHFRPSSFGLGAGISLAGGLAVLAGLIFGKTRRV